MKSRRQKHLLYEQKYADIPKDYQERLNWMYDKFHLNDIKTDSIYDIRNQMLSALQYSQEFLIILYEEPEGTPRPRARYVNKTNVTKYAKQYPGYVRIYSLTGASDKAFFKQLITDQDLHLLDQLIYTPCIVHYDAFFHTPTAFNVIDTYLAELGIIRPITKPDFDNIGKKYSDMMTDNIWIDDALVIEGLVAKYYSILPRIEIRLRFLNMLYNKYQYDSIIKRVQEGSDNVKYFQKD